MGEPTSPLASSSHIIRQPRRKPRIQPHLSSYIPLSEVRLVSQVAPPPSPGVGRFSFPSPFHTSEVFAVATVSPLRSEMSLSSVISHLFSDRGIDNHFYSAIMDHVRR